MSAEDSVTPIKVEARIVATPKSSKWVRELAFHHWCLNGGPECEVSEVARSFGVSVGRVFNWKERDGWDVKWAARMSEAEAALRGRSSFKVSQYVSQEQLDRSLMALYVGMTAVISEGGLNPRPRDGKERPLVSFRVQDYVTVIDRISTMLRREEDRRRLGGVLSEMPLGVTKEDLSILASLPPDKVKSLSLLADGFIEYLRDKDLVRRDAPTEGPSGRTYDSGTVGDAPKIPESHAVTSAPDSSEPTNALALNEAGEEEGQRDGG